MTDAKILQLEALSRGCVDSAARAEIDAQIAYHASRIGEFRLAHDIIDRIRSQPAESHAPSVDIWIILVDGILSFFENLDVGSRDRFKRAHALSAALKLNDLRALAAAWLAHAEFGRHQYDSMVNYVNDCLDNSGAVGHLASSRVGLVLASCYLYAGEERKSRSWYESARRSAILDGDRATIGAIMYNRAAIALTRYRTDECLSIPHTLDIATVRIAVLSASNFNARTGNRALSQILRMCEARLAMIESRFDVALEILEDIRRTGSRSLSGSSEEFFDLEYIFCLVRLGKFGKSDFLSQKFGIESIAALHCDDRVVFLFELLAIYKEFSVQHLTTDLYDLFGDAARAYIDGTKRLQISLQRVVCREEV
jgi:hypothetical protein